MSQDQQLCSCLQEAISSISLLVAGNSFQILALLSDLPWVL